MSCSISVEMLYICNKPLAQLLIHIAALRPGKLFPGPHLYAGAGIVILWAAAAALVPQMAKGSEVARTLHITLNCINLALFAWQIPTGLEIVGKVLEFAPVP